MHICFLCDEYPPSLHGGLGSVTQTLARAIARAGHEVSVLGVYAPQYAGRSDDEGIRVIRLPHAEVSGTGFVVNGFRLRQALKALDRESKIDIIEGAELSLAGLNDSVPGLKVIRLHGGHTFFTSTLGYQSGRWRQWMERRSFGVADAVCSVSRFVADQTRTLLSLGPRPIQVLPNPVDTAKFRPRPDIGTEENLILFFGSLCEKKGVRELVQAMPEVLSAVPDARLWIVGRDTRDPATGESFQKSLNGVISERLAARIDFKGPVQHKELPEIIAKAAVCVFPSHMESQGVVLLEAMAMGKAVVSSGIEPCRETLEDGQTGLLCDARKPASIADALIRALKDRDLRTRIAEAGRARVDREFSIDVMVRKNLDYYQRCLCGEFSA